MLKRIVVATCVALAPAAALADNTDSDTLTVSGAVVASLELTQNNAGLTMPALVLPSGAEPNTTVGMSCSGTGVPSVTYGNQGNPFADGTASEAMIAAGSANAAAFGTAATGVCASLTVTGEANYNFVATLANFTTTAGTITLGNVVCTTQLGFPFTSAAPANLTLNGTSLNVFCGANVVADTSASDYTATFDFTVTYD